MNSGAEAVETALKVARKWGCLVKGVAPDHGRIIVMDGNFHGRTTTIVGFSTDELARRDFGPFTPGFDLVPYGKADAVGDAITEDTIAVLLEPIQGEGGVLVPPAGFLGACADLCDRHGDSADCRRDPVRPGSHGPDAGRRTRRRGGGHRGPRQGPRRGDPAGVGDRGRRRCPRCDHPRHPRLDLRRQPARRGGRSRGVPHARDRRVPGARLSPGCPPGGRPGGARVPRSSARCGAAGYGPASTSTPRS